MNPGKKGKKKKSKTMDLMSFLSENGSKPVIPVKTSSWAEDTEDDYDGFSTRNNKEPVVLPTAPRAARDPGVNEENISMHPPFVAYISNLPYDIDCEDLEEFFAGLKVSSMRLPRDSNKLRGYGYVEFEDRQSLIDALSITNTVIKNRPIRIDVSNCSNDERRGGRMGRDNRRDGYDDPERTAGDWRSGPRDEATDNDHRGNRYDNRDRRDYRESSEIDNKPGAWRDREPSDRGRSTFRDRGGFRDDDKEGGRDGGRDWGRYNDRGSRDRDGGRDNRSGGGGFGPRRNFDDWDRDGPSRRGPSRADLPETKAEPRSRPKLQLQPRTKPIDPPPVVEESEQEKRTESPIPAASTPTSTLAPAPTSAPAPVPAANIFGDAKPVDTTAREREIEARLAKSKEESDVEKRPANRETWNRRNGEGRDDKDRSRQTWRSDEDSRNRRTERSAPRSQPRSEHSGDRKGAPQARGPPKSDSRGPSKSNDNRRPAEKDRKERERDSEKEEVTRMPKARDEQAPNFVASNKYSMLPDDVDPDNIDD